ncbi:HAMP domain-containing histidine kinase [Rhizobium sp. S95]|uniref:histidine kinase n=1 Tax=Ciceribacter sichuanensis TaxID=2949647 RepID=A0AAJ1BSR3_9HYPH|nr:MULTISPECIES: HAMP domain-containing sensor histidine kinase [unclassified Ciceribacter]MCM2395253.1 HAMP domain-containing histidine kinase [Ciceribacter sp. S95]MCO5955675.1 HAMP domain-containing histidine kinase [Ciceribacter sp. S101]
MALKSLTARVLLLATLWSAAALITIAVVISALYRQGVERGFNNLLRAQLYNVINSVSVSDGNSLAGSPELGDLRFSQPESGWYWLVEPLGSYGAAPLASTSLGMTNLPVPGLEEYPFDEHYERFYPMEDASGNRLRVAETEVVLDGEGRAARFRVSGNLEVVEEEISFFSTRLYAALALFGFGGLVVNGLAILYGLKPLDRARRALEKIRGGEAERIEGEFPREIQPLANEINALIDSNRRIVERARMQVGNLAHSLKTPIAVLLNEARTLDKTHGEVVVSQAEAMQGQVTSYLNRARIAAQRDSVLARTDAEPVLERLVRVMRRLNPETEFRLEVAPGLTFAMEQQDVEETVGNLLENAARFAKNTVLLRASHTDLSAGGTDSGRRHWIEVTVDDDGPGLKPDQIGEALKRGKRLDESKPGTGLGLSIVKEISSEYQGVFGLSRAEIGGLKARLVLPAVTRDTA